MNSFANKIISTFFFLWIVHNGNLISWHYTFLIFCFQFSFHNSGCLVRVFHHGEQNARLGYINIRGLTTVCPRSSDPFYTVTYYIKIGPSLLLWHTVVCLIYVKIGPDFLDIQLQWSQLGEWPQRIFLDCANRNYYICTRSSDPFYIVTYYIKWVTTFGTHRILKHY